MYTITDNQTTQITPNQPQTGKFFHWYKILGFYLISSSIYFLVSLFLINSTRSFYTQINSIGYNLVILILFYLIAPIFYVWKTKRSKNVTYSIFPQLAKLFFFELTGIFTASLLWVVMEAEIAAAQHWHPDDWTQILTNRIEFGVIVLFIIVGLYIFGYWLLSRSKKQPILLETSSVNINTQSFPKEQASSSNLTKLTKDDLLQLQQQPVQQDVNQNNYTYNEFITHLFNRAEWWKIGKAYYLTIGVYLSLIFFNY